MNKPTTEILQELEILAQGCRPERGLESDFSCDGCDRTLVCVPAIRDALAERDALLAKCSGCYVKETADKCVEISRQHCELQKENEKLNYRVKVAEKEWAIGLENLKEQRMRAEKAEVQLAHAESVLKAIREAGKEYVELDIEIGDNTGCISAAGVSILRAALKFKEEDEHGNG